MDARHGIRIIAAAVALAALTGGQAAAGEPRPPAPDEITNSFIAAATEQFGEEPQDVECVVVPIGGYDCTARLGDGSRLYVYTEGETWMIERTEIPAPDTDLGRAAQECIDTAPEDDIDADDFTFYDAGLSVFVDEFYSADDCMVQALDLPEWVGHADFGILRFGDWWVMSEVDPTLVGSDALLIMANEVAPHD